MDERNIYWFEEPLNIEDLSGAAKLVNNLTTPIALGENQYTCYGFRDVIEKGAADILNADAQVLGGINEWEKVANLAQANHILVVPHGDQEIHVHLVCAIPNGLMLEYYDTEINVLRDAIFEEKLELNDDGTVSPPQRPGLGVKIKWDELEKYRIE